MAKASSGSSYLGVFVVASAALGFAGWAFTELALKIGARGAVAVVTVVAALGAAALIANAAASAKGSAKAAVDRHNALVQRFGDDVTRRIEAKEIWQGATQEMLLASLGNPEEFDEKVMKRTTRLTFKYGRVGATRQFALRVVLEDGIVVGWER